MIKRQDKYNKDNKNNIYHLTLDEYFMKVYGYDVKSLFSLDNETFNLSEEVMNDIKHKFDEIKEIREYNQYKVLKAMQEAQAVTCQTKAARYADNPYLRTGMIFPLRPSWVFMVIRSLI